MENIEKLNGGVPIQPGDTGVTIEGTGFGSVEGVAKLNFAGQGYTFIIESWTDTLIVATAPNDLPSGVTSVCSVTAFGNPVPLDSNYVSRLVLADALAVDAVVGTSINTSGYTTVNDGGGSPYVVVPPNTGTPDGVSYINMVNGNQLELVSDKSKADTFAHLRTIEPVFKNQVITLIGHTVAGFGGGTFVYDAGDTTSADDNGVVAVTVGGARWRRSGNANLYLLENFGALKGDVDNAIAINAACKAARDSGSVNVTVESNMQGVIEVGAVINALYCNIVTPTITYRLRSVNTFNFEDVVFDIDYSGTGFTSNRRLMLIIDGNNVDLADNLTMCKIDNARSSNSNYEIQASNCYKGLKLGDFVERSSVMVSGYNAEILCDDGSSATDGGGDENIITVRGNTCAQWYRNHDQTSSHVTFGVEASRSFASGIPAVHIQTGKSCALSGIIRGTDGDAVVVDEGSGRNGHAHFDNLQVIQVSNGTGLKVPRMTGLSGHIYVEKCKTDAKAVEIGRCPHMSMLKISAAEGDSDSGVPVTFGYDPTQTLENTSVDVEVTYSGSSGVAMIIDRVSYFNVNALVCLGNVEVTSSSSRATIGLSNEFIRHSRTVTNLSTGSRLAVLIKGILDFSTITAKTWFFSGITFEQVREAPTFTGGQDVVGLSFKNYTSGVARFVCDKDLKASTSSLSSITNDMNTYLKFDGQRVYDVSTNKVLVSNGSNSSDGWYNTGTGVLEIAPT